MDKVISNIYKQHILFNLKKKMGRRIEQKFFQRVTVWLTHKKMLNIANHQGNANQKSQ